MFVVLWADKIQHTRLYTRKSSQYHNITHGNILVWRYRINAKSCLPPLAGREGCRACGMCGIAVGQSLAMRVRPSEIYCCRLVPPIGRECSTYSGVSGCLVATPETHAGYRKGWLVHLCRMPHVVPYGVWRVHHAQLSSDPPTSAPHGEWWRT